MCKRLTLKKYATTRSIAHITIYNKHKHNHHCSHGTSSSLELSQSMPKLISTTGSYWNGRIPVAISNSFFPAEIFGLLCTETVEAVIPKAVESYRDVTIGLLLYNLRLQVNSWPKHARSRGCSGYFPCPFSRDILVLICDS